MIVLENDCLEISVPEVHEAARCSIEFHRTLRIPDDGRGYPLPPGLGRFALRHVDDYAERAPRAWLDRGGVLMPMHQAEALWIAFRGHYPFAVKVATGKICAITGDPWLGHLNSDPQDYLVRPEQPWLDGYCVEQGVIRQFVAMPLGDGYTVEEQLTGAGVHGGIQIVAYPMKRKWYEALARERRPERWGPAPHESPPVCDDMGLAPGGRMRQQVYSDDHGLDAWDQRQASRCFVTIANSRVWRAITGEAPPGEPPTARQYTDAGLPWFDYYGENTETESGSDKLRGTKSVSQMGLEKTGAPMPHTETVATGRVVRLGESGARRVRESP